jgi:hypothetical protein
MSLLPRIVPRSDFVTLDLYRVLNTCGGRQSWRRAGFQAGLSPRNYWEASDCSRWKTSWQESRLAISTGGSRVSPKLFAPSKLGGKNPYDGTDFGALYWDAINNECKT